MTPSLSLGRTGNLTGLLLRQGTSAGIVALLAWVQVVVAQDSPATPPQRDVFRRENLVAWCIVPFDAKRRGPRERVEMLQRLGFRKYAYDWRAEHLPTFDEELRWLHEAGIELTAVWFPTELNDEARTILTLLAKHGVKTQLWVTGGGTPVQTAAEQQERIQAEVRRLRPIAEAAARIGCQVGLYNHGGWFGEPANQLAILKALGLPNVGLVYNLHHGHDHLEDFEKLWGKIRPHVLALNLNGMVPRGDQLGQKILPLGAGTEDAKLLRIIRDSGYDGPIGILGHTQDDAEDRLRDNLEGLDWLLRQAAGGPPEPPPRYRTYSPAGGEGKVSLVPGRFGQALDGRTGGVTRTGHAALREPPWTLELWVRLWDPQPYNILVACEPKNSPTHWELFTMAGSGQLTVYIPGCQPDHVRSSVNVCDDQWHHVVMHYEPQRIVLYVDGRQVAAQAVEPRGRSGAVAQPPAWAVGRLVEGGLGCRGLLDEVHLRVGVHPVRNVPTQPPVREASTRELWHFDDPGELGGKAASTAAPRGKNHWGKEVVGFDWTESDSVDGRWNETEVGPFLASLLPLPNQPTVRKGLSLRLQRTPAVTLGYDTHTCRWRAGWVGGFLRFDAARYGLINPPQVQGELAFVLGEGPGWRHAKGAAPVEVRHRSLRRLGDQVVLESTVGGVQVREVAGAIHLPDVGATVFTRDLELGAGSLPLQLALGPCEGAPRVVGQILEFQKENSGIRVTVDGALDLAWELEGQTAWLTIPAGADVRRVRWRLCAAPGAVAVRALEETAALPLFDWARLEQPVPSTPPTTVVTRGQRAADNAAYVIDTLTLPFENPDRALCFVSGFDFLGDDTLAVCMVHGDVWLVSGVDDDVEQLTWRRFATGLFQPLGLKVVDETIYVLGRDQITRLRDTNGDGTADVYENFCNGYETSAGGHDYVACLEVDTQGRFYFVHATQGLLRVSADGQQVSIVATGFRNPNGMGLGPGGELTVSPQEGEWTPASSICQVREGGHYGYPGPRPDPSRPRGYDLPLCWIPRAVDNSSGGQVWAGSNWGPLSGQMLHLSYGQCRVLPVLREEVEGVWQGATVDWPLRFASGVCRGRVHPRDGQVYVGGLRGWVTSAVQDGCLQRIRYTGMPAGLPTGFATYANGLELQFSEPLDRETAEDAENYRVQRWDYRYGREYGSAEYQDVVRGVEGRVHVEVISATLRGDGRTVFLELRELRPAMQYAVTGDIRRATGEDLRFAVYPTLHHVPARVRAVEGKASRRRSLPVELQQRLQPGVQVLFQQGDRQGIRADRLVAWHVLPEEVPAAGLVAGRPFTARVSGWLQMPLREQVRFRLVGRGTARLKVDEQSLWEGRLEASGEPTAAVELSSGYHALEVEYANPSEGPAWLRGLWSGASFAEEPWPPTLLWHDPQQPGWKAAEERAAAWGWYRQWRCGNCHAHWARLPAELAEGPDLTEIGRRVQPGWLVAWLLNPQQLRHEATMPRFWADTPAGRQAAADVARYLVEAGPAGDNRFPKPTLRARQVGETSTERASAAKAGAKGALSDELQVTGAALWEDLGCLVCHRMTPPGTADRWERVSLWESVAKYAAGELAEFLRRPQAHWPGIRMPDFRLSEAESAALVTWLEAQAGPSRPVPAEWETASIERGGRLVEAAGCRRCHRLGGPVVAPSPPIPFRGGEGCLSRSVSAGEHLPVFALGDEERAGLRLVVDEVRARPEEALELAPVEETGWWLRRLNCAGCHPIDHQRGPRGELVAEESERGIPPEPWPSLTWAGEKLRGPWLRRFLAGEMAERPRPWLRGRMPAFPATAELLTRGLLSGHGWGMEDDGDEPSSARREHLRGQAEVSGRSEGWSEEVEVGRRLTAAVGGLDCRQCHGMAGDLPVGDERTRLARGIDFLLMRERMRREHFVRFVLDPPRFDVATRMPKLIVDGRTSKITEVYEGDAVRQVEAIWAYLQAWPNHPR